MLVEGGADNVNQCFLEASRFGSIKVVRILFQIAQRNNLDVDVDLALGFASHYGKIGTMECLVEEGNAIAFLGPLMRASERGCIPVVQWFVQRGCRDMELCLALKAATSSSQVQVDKLKILSESLAGSASKAEKRILDNRIQKEEALKFRVAKTSEVNVQEKGFKDVLENFGSNIIFSNGLLDPWSGGSVLESISETIVALATEKVLITWICARQLQRTLTGWWSRESAKSS